ncbi:Smr protein/MutS2 C-terminal [Macleaya cordata]|uniref:Smr protein/MutS2 C-terminal n=1 Tax=Macleaya cordata TaxID=56857 RepID=A0A200QAD4_MACCD|nr:Smr protein/MutS2 C-terminal [Macleaya cordata]
MRDGVREKSKSKMTISASTSHSKMLARGRSAGWAAFDLKQQEKQGLRPESETDPYPPIANALTSIPLNGVVNGRSSSVRSFSSVVQPSIDSPNLMGNGHDFKGQLLVASSSRKLGNKVVTDLDKLNELHNWADDCLIEDILGAVNNDFSRASALLQSMVSSGSSKGTIKPSLAENCSSFEDRILDKQSEQADIDVCLEKTTDSMGMSFALEECLFEQKEEKGEGFSSDTNLSDNTTPVKLISRQFIFAPVEPEWEEDDVYLSHRKDAIRAVRSAAQHSQAARNAFVRGDHSSAQKLSQKAQGEWMAAEKLHFKAAQEILSIKNSKNDVWKLDLHGLHASEAVHALKEHLWKIETQILSHRSVLPNGTVKPKADSPLDSVSCFSMELKTDKEQGISMQRPAVLQVITGTGHSRGGQAALPVAVRSFLIENGYRFDESRSGVIAVHPKFRGRHS